MRTKRPIPFKTQQKFAILVDGQTEAWYLQMLKRNEPSLGVDIKPELPAKKTLEAQYERVCELSTMYDKVYWIIDLDVVLRESRQAPKGRSKAILEFDKWMKQIERYDNVTVIINNPCLEFWFLLHFEYTTKGFTACANAEKQLKTYLSKYEKTEKFFTKQNNDIYLQLKPYLEQAIRNANSLPPFSHDDVNQSLSEMYKLFDELSFPMK